MPFEVSVCVWTEECKGGEQERGEGSKTLENFLHTHAGSHLNRCLIRGCLQPLTLGLLLSKSSQTLSERTVQISHEIFL